MATLRTVAFILAATFLTVQSQATNKRESLNFLQQANSFDPENLNEEEGYYPEESELPNGDHQVVFNGPEGREACVVCQRSSTNDDIMATTLRRLQIDVELLKKKLDGQDGLVSDKEAKKEKDKKRPHQVPTTGLGQPPQLSLLPAPAPEEAPKISLLPAPAPVEGPKISLLPAPLPVEGPKLSLLPAPLPVEGPKISLLPAPVPEEGPKISLLPAPLPVEGPKISLLPAPVPEEEQEISALPAPAEPLLPEEKPEEILKDIDELDLESMEPSTKEALNEIKRCLDKRTKTAEQPTTAEDKQKRDKELIDAKANYEKEIEKETDPQRRNFLLEIIRRIQSFITKTIHVEIRTSSGKETKIVTRGAASIRGRIRRLENDDDDDSSQHEVNLVGSDLPALRQILEEATGLDKRMSVQLPAQTPLELAEEWSKDED